jgi:hypothetical protein
MRHIVDRRNEVKRKGKKRCDKGTEKKCKKKKEIPIRSPSYVGNLNKDRSPSQEAKSNKNYFISMAVILDKFVVAVPLVWALPVSPLTLLSTPSWHFLHRSSTCMFVSSSSSSSQNKTYFPFVIFRII